MKPSKPKRMTKGPIVPSSAINPLDVCRRTAEGLTKLARLRGIENATIAFEVDQKAPHGGLYRINGESFGPSAQAVLAWIDTHAKLGA